MRTAAEGRLLEDGIDAAAAASFAAAAAFALAKLAPQFGVATVGASMLAFGGCWAVLRRVPREQPLPLPGFELAHFEAEVEEEELEVLLLTAEQVAGRAGDRQEGDELLLDDVLDAIAPDSQVVRLFVPDQLPTAGQLKANIDRHLQARRSSPPIADASQALSDALAELRRSLR